MKTKAVRLYGKNDLRLDEFELPVLQNDQIFARVVSDSICMSSHKTVLQGSGHKRVPANIAAHPVIIGHEFCGEILEVGSKWSSRFHPGDKFAIQPALSLKDDPMRAPGYSYELLGGAATYIVIPNEVMEQDCLLIFKGDAFFHGSLAEPMSCIVGAFHAQYHAAQGTYRHEMGIRENGNMAILAGAGPMGQGAIDYAIHGPRRPRLLAVADIDRERLERAALIHTPGEALEHGVVLHYVNIKNMTEPAEQLRLLTGANDFDDVFIFAPVKSLVELGDAVAGRDCCLNFFAGPTDPGFTAKLNFYNIHYNMVHVVGTSGGNTDDLLESLRLMEQKLINPAAMITHVGGLTAVVDTTLRLPEIPGGKKLIYTNIDLALTAIADLRQIGKHNPLFTELARLVEQNRGQWCKEAEDFLLSHAPVI